MDEYINRETVVRCLKEYSEKECNSNSPYGMIISSILNKVERTLSEMPTVDVQPVVHGYWEDCEIRGTLTQSCSVCGSDCGVLYSYNFCPNCGARMDLKDGDAE